VGNIVPIKIRKRDHFDALTAEQVARMTLKLSEDDEAISMLLSPEESMSLEIQIQSDLIAIRMVSRGIVL